MVLTFEDTIKRQLPDHENSHFMMVDGMSKLMTGKTNNCWSSDFEIDGLQWRLVIRWKSSERDHLSIRLQITDKKCTGPNWNVKCGVILTHVCEKGNHNILESLQECFDEDSKFCRGSIPLRTFKKRILVNDKAVFSAEIIDAVASFPVTPNIRDMGTAECIKLFELPPNNYRFTWKITRFSSFNGKRHSSYEFTVGPRRWRLVMYPEGKTGKAGNFSVYLAASDYVTSSQKKETFANYKLRLLDQVNRNHHETGHRGWFSKDDEPENSERGMRKFMPLEELHDPSNGYLVNDQIYIGVDFLLVATTESL